MTDRKVPEFFPLTFDCVTRDEHGNKVPLLSLSLEEVMANVRKREKARAQAKAKRKNHR